MRHGKSLRVELSFMLQARKWESRHPQLLSKASASSEPPQLSAVDKRSGVQTQVRQVSSAN